jgi:carotenoid 1,2-hydratase
MLFHTGDIVHPPTSLEGLGAYAWRYTDVLSDDGEWAVVLIAFIGMPMSPDYLLAQAEGHGEPEDYCGQAVSVYYRGKRIAFSFLGTCFEPPDPLCMADVEVQCEGAELPAKMMEGADPHAWVLVAPRRRARVHVTLREEGAPVLEHTFEGWAYTDRNGGKHAMQEDFRDWYWGRIHAPDRTVVYLATPNASTPFLFVGHVLTGSSVLEKWSNVNITLSDYRPTIMGLWAATSIRLDGECDNRTNYVVARRHSVLDSGPFYSRYLARFEVNGVKAGMGIAEYMDVRRLGAPWIRPFLRLPWRSEF